jgi:hypothetical protein
MGAVQFAKWNPGEGKPSGAGSWAECYQTSRDERSVTWAFRIQGTEGSASLAVGGRDGDEPHAVDEQFLAPAAP